ncbi:MAG TPA: anthranilate synthase component I [Actinomycetota bacterium]|nr:anthranilate synthase component I [Actinomycetota bacterium]
MSLDRTLYRPGLDGFKRLAESHTVVPVWREVIADLETPVSAWLKVAKSRNSFLLESAERGERWSRYSFVGVDPFLVLRVMGDEVQWEGDPPQWATGRNPLEIVQSTVEGYRAPRLDGLPPLHGGAVGYIGYDAVRHIESLPPRPQDPSGLPDVQLQFSDRVIAFDHFRQVLSVIVNVVPGDRPEADYEDAIHRCEDLIAYLRRPLEQEPVAPPRIERQNPPPSNVSRQRWREMLAAAREHILSGDVFQVVLSQRFVVEDLRASPVDVYRMLRLVNPSPYMYLLRFGDTWVIGSSPEALVRVEGRTATTHPIAGTRWRGLTPDSDRSLEQELLSDDKERAEHVMLVDLARNDLGRVCEYGSVEVPRMLDVQRYSHLMHLVSEVTGQLRDGVTAFDVLKATFPAGTVTGAPKVRAMQIIDDLEEHRRGVYAGVVGYFDFSGNLDTAIALRTAVIARDTAWVQAGGGIVADSDPDDEYLECLNKASAVVNAIRAAEALQR